MEARPIVCCVLTALLLCGISCADKVNLNIRTLTAVAKTDDNFVCAMLDWWPETKADHKQRPWGKAGILNLDLQNKILANAIKAFNPLRIRVGGSLQDQVVYQVGNMSDTCRNFELDQGGLFGFSNGCLTMDRWDELSQFFNQTGAKITFGLNALLGRSRYLPNDTLWVGPWQWGNARDFMMYNVLRGYQIDSYELGNELAGNGVAARLTAEQYALDIHVLKRLVGGVHSHQVPLLHPRVLGPAGFYNQGWFQTFLSLVGPNIIHGVSHHIHKHAAGVGEDPLFVDRAAQTLKDFSRSVELFAPWAGAWVGEAARDDDSHTISNGLWYLDQMGMAAAFNHKVYCRHVLIGGSHGLLNTTSFVPNPDYYSALLWHRLMGSKVLSVSHNGSPYLRAYAHCSKNAVGKITVLLINMSNTTTFEVTVVDDHNLYPGISTQSDHGGEATREEYRLTPSEGSDMLMLNGSPLQLTEASDIPDLIPHLFDDADVAIPVVVMPRSIVFATLKGHHAPACYDDY